MLIIDLLSVRGLCVWIDLLLDMSDGQGHLIVCMSVFSVCVLVLLCLLVESFISVLKG